VEFWRTIGQGIFFTFQEINWVEHKMCLYPEWQLDAESSALKEFKSIVYISFPLSTFPAYPHMYRNTIIYDMYDQSIRCITNKLYLLALSCVKLLWWS
jgi:hypothetical protein